MISKEEAAAKLEALDREERLRSRVGIGSYLMLNALPYMAMAEAMSPMPKRHLGLERGEHGRPKSLDNDPGRAPGMKEFLFDRHGELDPHNPDPEWRIYAGTLKAARKKLALLRNNL